MAAMSDAINVYVTPSEPSTDLTPRIVEIDSDGNERSLERAGLTEEQKTLLFFLLLIILLAQASCFSSFQVLNILLILMQGSATEAEQLIAVWSALTLLAIAAGTVLSEATIRFINWSFAEATDVSENRLLFLVALLKTITVSLFCANFYFEQVKTFDLVVAKTGSDFFVGLVMLECVVSAAMSAHLPSENFLSTALFIDSFLKALLSVAATLQLNETTALAGFFMAAILFAFVTMNVTLMIINGYADLTKTPLQPDPSHHNDINVAATGSINNDSHHPESAALLPLVRGVTQSTHQRASLSSQPAFFTNFCQGVNKRLSHIPRYLRGEGSSPAHRSGPGA